MPKKKHKPIPLTGASKILRAHSTQIQPPGLYEMRDLYLSRSDNSMGLRSDWEPAYAGMFSYGSLIQGLDTEDYLNAAFYVDRAGHTIWFGRWAPFTWAPGFGQLFTIYDTGTITTNGSTSEVVGQGTEWLQQVWPGCLIKQTGEGNDLYVVQFVTTDLRLVTTEIMPDLNGAEYEIFRTHPAVRANWPIKMDSLGGFLIYGTVDITQPVDENYISGPFYSNIGRPNLGVWFGTDPAPEGIGIPINSITVGDDLRSQIIGVPRSFFYPIVIAGQDGAMFGKNWFGDRAQGTTAEVVGVSSGTFKNISWMRMAGSSISIVTLDGDYIRIQESGKEIIDDYWELFDVEAEPYIQKFQPFGQVELYGGGSFLCGAGGLLGVSGGGTTTYSTGVTTALRGMCDAEREEGPVVQHYVVVGDADSTDGVILYFTDPTSISRATTGTDESFVSVSYSLYYQRLVAVGTAGLCMTSDDNGANWTPRSVGTADNINAVVWDKEGRCCCAVCDDDYGTGQVFISLDAITWTQVNGVGSQTLLDVTFNGVDGSFYAVSTSGAVIRIRRRVHIQNGGTDLGYFGTNSDFVCDAQFDGTRFIAVGSGIWTSFDAITWTLRETPTNTLTAVALDLYDTNILVAVGLGGLVYRSTDAGTNWTAVSSGVTTDLMGVVYDGSGSVDSNFIAVGAEGTVIRSEAGIGWTTMAFPVDTDLLAISSRWAPTGLADTLNVFVSGSDGKIYVTHNNRNNSPYIPWAEWAEQPASLYYQDSEFLERGEHAIIYTKQAMNSIYVTDGSFRLGGCSNRAQIMAFPEVSQVEIEVNIGFSSYPITQGSWIYINGENSFSVIDFGELYPTIVSGFAAVVSGTGRYYYCFLTSTDGGRTWSTSLAYGGVIGGEPNPQATPQFTGQTQVYPPVTIANQRFVPTFSDGVDFFIIQSSNGISGKPRTIALSGYELAYSVWEVE